MTPEILVNAVVAFVVGSGERCAVNRDGDAEVIKAVAVGFKAEAYVPHGLASGQLSEKEVQELVVTGEAPRVVVTEVARDALVEFISWYKVCHL